jgi:hypothetical protein
MPRRLRYLIVLVSSLTLLATSVASAHHPDRGDGAHGDSDVFPGETEAHKQQHGGEGGHLPAVNRNLAVNGKADVRQQGGESPRGRVADVAAHGNHAYLTAFRTDDCLGGGAWIVDIADPTAPFEVGFLPTTDGNYAGEGSQVITPEHGEYAGRQLFIHQNETCDAALAAADADRGGSDRFLGGINIWDVTDPADPELLIEHTGDFTTATGLRHNPTTVHSAFAWNSHVDERTYVVLVDNEEFTDVDILDITDPTEPVLVNDTLDLVDLFGVDQASPSNLTSVFNHDMMVYRKGDRYVMNVNYWDGGYVLLDVTDPTPGNVSLIAQSDYAELDEERLKRGHEIAPEGNAHQSEFSPDFRFLIGTDEDFNPFRLIGRLLEGPHAGEAFNAAAAGDAAQLGEDDSIEGTMTFVGLACAETGGDEVAPVDGGTALIERGVCPFQEKLDAIVAAGYDAGVVFNNPAACDGLVNRLAAGDVPFLFVGRTSALKLLGESDPTCATDLPAIGTQTVAAEITSEFAGWGYVRLFRTNVPGAVGQTGSIEQIDTYAIPEAQDEAFAMGFGDLTVHEVATDPRSRSNIAYFSYYAGGFRVAEYDQKGIREVGAFIDEGGNNFWGVEVHKVPTTGEQLVLRHVTHRSASPSRQARSGATPELPTANPIVRRTSRGKRSRSCLQEPTHTRSFRSPAFIP